MVIKPLALQQPEVTKGTFTFDHSLLAIFSFIDQDYESALQWPSDSKSYQGFFLAG